MELSAVTMVNPQGELTILNTYHIIGIKEIKGSLLFELDKIPIKIKKH
jgi:hypothetical protein